MEHIFGPYGPARTEGFEVTPMKTPFVTKEQLEAIAAQYPTPFHIYDEKGIRENARRLKAAFAWNPGYREYFAVKATPPENFEGGRVRL